MSLVSRSLKFRNTVRNANRLRTIVGVFVRHGFANVAERMQLGRFIVKRFMPEATNQSIPERVRLSMEELGPTFVKLGQVLAGRPDLVPEDWTREFARLHDNVKPLTFAELEPTLIEELGPDYRENFLEIDETPLGSASIAQVHRAVLKDGRQVVIKIQRPGILETIKDDLSVLFQLAELVETYVPEVRSFRPRAIVEEFFSTLQLETSFVVEANNIRRFNENFKDSTNVIIPQVEMSLVTERVLVMQMLNGYPLSSPKALEILGDRKKDFLRAGLKAYLKMVFMDGLFHGDLHAGNFFVMPDAKIGLIDFGLVGRLNARTQKSIANMLLALAREDYEKLAYEYLDLAPFSETAVADDLARDLRNLVAPYFGLTLEDVNLGKVLMSSAGTVARHQIAVPAELMLFFKSLIGIESLGRRIDPAFDFLSHSLEFAGELVRHQYDPAKIANELAQTTRDSKNLLTHLPRMVFHLLRRISSPDYVIRHRVDGLPELRSALNNASQLLFLALIISALIISGALLQLSPRNDPSLQHFTIASLGGAFILGILGFINYIRRP